MFSGSIVALVTPFEKDGGVDFSALKKMIDFHIEEGTEGLVLCGSTGEGALLTSEEKLSIFAYSAEAVKGRIPIVANTGTCSTRESIFLTESAKRVGVDGALVIVPYYCRPTEEGIYRHFVEIAEVGLPLIAYHHPGRTGIKLSVEGLANLAEIPNVEAIKEASCDLEFATKVMELTSCPLLSGDDVLAFAQMAIGFQGSISIVGNVIPHLWKEMVDAALAKHFDRAKVVFDNVVGLCRALVLETNPQCVKYAAHLSGLCSSALRLPLIEPSKENQLHIERELNEIPKLLGQLCH